MFSRPKILFLVSLLFVALLNPKFNPYLLFKFLIFYHSSVYMGDLLKLDACRAPSGIAILMILRAVRTPLHWDQWDQQLESHPDERFREFIVIGIREGFRVGFDYPRTCQSSRRNMHSAEERSQGST